MFEIFINAVQIIFWFIVILVPLVVVHELGHLLFARLFGVKIPEFGVGLPLTNHRITKKYKGINWSFYPWLLGGFVRIYGDHDVLDEYYTLAITDPIKAKEGYSESRIYEVLSQNLISELLKENFLDSDASWEWFSRVGYLDKEIDAKNLNKVLSAFSNLSEIPEFVSNFDHNNLLTQNPKKYYDNLPSVNKDLFVKSCSDEYKRLKNLAKTLIDWEFDSKIISKNTKALKEAFFAKNIFAQIFIISGGVIFNVLAAVILFCISFGILGTIPEVYSISGQPILGNQIQNYEKNYKVNVLSKGLVVNPISDSPLIAAGLVAKDEIIQIADRNLEKERVNSLDELSSLLNNYENKEIQIKYYRGSNNSYNETKVVLQKDSQKNKVLLKAYVGYKAQRSSKGFFNILPDAIGETSSVIGATFSGIGDIIKASLPQATDRSALGSVTGPIGIGYASNDIFIQTGLSGIVYLLAIVSIALAVFNILPVPALDGGRLLILIIGKLTGKRYKNIETWAISITFFILMVLGIVIAGFDIQRIITK